MYIRMYKHVYEHTDIFTFVSIDAYIPTFIHVYINIRYYTDTYKYTYISPDINLYK